MEATVEEAVEAAMPTGEDAADEVETQAFDEDRLAGILESVLFASGEPIGLKRLVEVLDGPSPAEVRGALRLVAERLEISGRGLRLVEVAGGYQLRTASENAEWVRAVFRDKPRKLGRAALETLSVIAYRQPVTRADVEAVRGVDIDAVLTTLLLRNLVKVVGRKEAVGRPILYGTSETFLELFGFRDLSELPTLKELPQGPEVNPDESANPASGAEAAGLAGVDEAQEQVAGADTDDGRGASAEAPEPGGNHLEAQGGGTDPGGEGEAERAAGEGAGDEGEPGDRSH